MNRKSRDEGLALAEMVLTYEFSHVNVLIQSDYQYDGFLSAVNELFIGFQGDLKEEIILQNESANSILIELQRYINSRAVSTIFIHICNH